MMKNLILICAMLTISLFSFAQENSHLPNSPFRWGVKAGIVNTEVSDEKESGLGTTYFIGGKVDICFNKDFYLESGLNFIGKGYTMTSKSQRLSNDITGTAVYENVDQRQKVTGWYMELPVNAMFKRVVSYGHLFGGAGVFLGLGLFGDLKDNITTVAWSPSNPDDRITSERHYKKDLTFGTDINRVELGLNYILGYQLNCGLDVHAGYRQSLTRFRPDIKEMSRAYAIGMGFTF